MKLRESCLPAGWYPRNQGEISRFLSGFSHDKAEASGRSVAAIAPHAGWYYSGKIAAKAAASLNKGSETLVVIGGHLPAGSPPLFALEDAVSTPLGNIPINTGLRDFLYRELNGKEDRFSDNTVEVLLPMVRFFYPNASLLWLRLPADMSSFDAGKAVAAAAVNMKQTVAVLASTDLTHYGPNYRFTPKGTGEPALCWVKETNDRRFIDAVESGNPAKVLKRAEEELSSCSAGAVLGALGFASAVNSGPARLLEYGTSADVQGSTEVPDSFVGYAAITFAG